MVKYKRYLNEVKSKLELIRSDDGYPESEFYVFYEGYNNYFPSQEKNWIRCPEQKPQAAKMIEEETGGDIEFEYHCNKKDDQSRGPDLHLLVRETIRVYDPDTLNDLYDEVQREIKKRNEVRVEKITFVRPRKEEMPRVIINEDWQNPLKNIRARSWIKLFRVAEGEKVKAGKNIISYFNSNNGNPIYTQTGLSKTKILGQKRECLVPEVELQVIAESTYQKKKRESQ